MIVIFSNTPLEGMWGIVNILQLLSYLTLMKLAFPKNLLNFLEYIQIVHNFNSFLPNMFEYILDKDDLNMSSFSETFESREIPNRNILLLCGCDIEMIIILLLLCISTKLLAKHIKFIGKLDKKFRYNGLIRNLIVSYVKLGLAASISFQAVNLYLFYLFR